MSFQNLSYQMQVKIEVLDEMVEQGYIEPIKPLAEWLPTLCFYPKKTPKFVDAPGRLKQEFSQLFSWYAFSFPMFAFFQVRLERDYLKLITIILLIVTLIPSLPILPDLFLGILINIFVGKIFVFSRYYQYKTYGKCPTNRNIFSVICFSLIYLFAITLVFEPIHQTLYPNSSPSYLP
jgi:hypothetical protein